MIVSFIRSLGKIRYIHIRDLAVQVPRSNILNGKDGNTINGTYYIECIEIMYFHLVEIRSLRIISKPRMYTRRCNNSCEWIAICLPFVVYIMCACGIAELKTVS